MAISKLSYLKAFFVLYTIWDKQVWLHVEIDKNFVEKCKDKVDFSGIDNNKNLSFFVIPYPNDNYDGVEYFEFRDKEGLL